MAEVTISGSADDLSSAVQSVADREKQRQEEMEREAKKAEQEYKEEQKEIEEEIREDEEMPEPQQFDFDSAFAKLGETIVGKLDELKPKVSEEEARAARTAELEAELAALKGTAADPPASAGPTAPPRKKTSPPAGKPDGDSGDSSDDPPPKTRKWYSWNA